MRDATGHLVRAGFLGLFVLAGPVGAVDSYWRSLPVVALFVVCLVTAAGLGALLFRREWRAAAHTYGIPIHTANSAPEGAAQ